MKLGLSTESFATAIRGGRMTLARIIEYASDNGYEGIEINNSRDTWQRDISDDIKMNLARMRDKKARYYGYAVKEDLAARDKTTRWRSMNKVRESILLASITNVKHVCITGCGMTEENQTWEEAENYFMEMLKECLELAERKKVTLSVMNGGRIINGSTRMLKILQDIGSEYLQASLDIASFLLVDEEPADAVRTLMGSINSVHFTDVRSAEAYASDEWTTIKGRQLMPCALGEGVVPQREVLYTLKQIDYDGFVTILYLGDEEPAVGIERSTTYLRTMMRDIGTA